MCIVVTLLSLISGRIRNQRDSIFDETDGQVLSLNLISSHYVQKSNDERTFYHFTVAWDSSLHNSLLLNRCTSSGSAVYLTVSSYLEIENSFQPVVISKDLCLVLCPRGGDSAARLRSSLRNFFLVGQSIARPSVSSVPESMIEPTQCVSAIYELTLKQAMGSNRMASDAHRGSPGAQRRQRRVIDTSKIYVRGEEMLHDWRPRSDSLILEHQQDLEKLYKIECVRSVRRRTLSRTRSSSLGPTYKTCVASERSTASTDENEWHRLFSISPQ